jgi:hypothetical protein
MQWTTLAMDRNQWVATVKALIGLQIPQEVENFLATQVTTRCERTATMQSVV